MPGLEVLQARSMLHDPVTAALIRYSWRLPFLRVILSRRAVICLYHGVSASDGATFEQHVVFLKRHCDLISPEEIDRPRRRHERVRVLLTFDDGFRNHAEVVAPILRRHRAPAIFFVPSRHTTSGRYLWFSHLLALERHFTGEGFVFRGQRVDMAPKQRHASIKRLTEVLLGLMPHPVSIYEAIERELPPLEEFVPEQDVADLYAGMTAEQIGDLASDPLFTIGAHTVDHPLLSRCAPHQAVRQIQENKRWLEEITNRPCTAIAYPSGNYDASVLAACRELGFSRGYATTPVVGRDRELEIPRMGIYAASLDALGFKIHWGHVVRAMGAPIG
jgi:peptidoglycan/xylan/chitin deacetylase (PgdA/CDA1 family)